MEYELGNIITLYNVGDNVLFRGDNPNWFSSNSYAYYRFVLSGSIGAYNSITYLIDKTGQRMDIPGDYCYSNMFNGCKSLTQAPELPATTLVNDCYLEMFNGCTSLNYIKINYIGSLPASKYATSSWLNNTSASGDAYFNGIVTDGGSASSIPSSWTIHSF